MDAFFDGRDYHKVPTEILINKGKIVGLTRPGAGTREGDYLRACFASPAFIDAHIHFVGYAKSFLVTNLCGVETADDLRKRLECAPEVAGWVFGRGWEDARLRFRPHRSILDRILPDKACSLRSRCGHSLWANTAALKEAGITAETETPENGVIERDEDGSPTGILKESAISLIEDVAPSLSSADTLSKAMDKAVESLIRYGIGGLCIIADRDDVKRIRQKNLPMPYRLLLECDPEVAVKHNADGVKLYKDGSLGNLGALMWCPYAGTEDRGIEVTSDEELEKALLKAVGRLRIFAVHAIGDYAVEKTVALLASYSHKARLKRTILRVEHFQTASVEAIRKAAKSYVIASVQPCHQYGDVEAAKSRLKERARLMYRLRTMEKEGVVLAFGSDAPVETPDTLRNIQAAQDVGTEGVYGNEAVDLEVAFKAYTEGAAVACGWADDTQAERHATVSSAQRGRIAEGYEADVILFEEDPFDEGLLRSYPSALLISGEVV